jgi:hypothetical protein
MTKAQIIEAVMEIRRHHPKARAFGRYIFVSGDQHTGGAIPVRMVLAFLATKTTKGNENDH